MSMTLFRVFPVTASLFFAASAPCWADPAPLIHYAPVVNLEHIDVALIDTARREINMAAYVPTDWPMRPLSVRLQRTNRRGRSLSDSRPLFERRVSAKALGTRLNKY